jgi:hypothetical protein
MTESEARRKLIELDRRYRLILGSLPLADLIRDKAVWKRMPEVERKYSATEFAIEKSTAI